MFLVDAMMVSGLRWILQTVADAAEAALDDEGPLREGLLAVAVRFEAGEISAEEFAQAEEEILARLREIRARRGEDRAPIALAGAGEGGMELEVEVPLDDELQPTPATEVRAAPVRRRRHKGRPAC